MASGPEDWVNALGVAYCGGIHQRCMFRFSQERQPQLLWALGLLMAGSNGVVHSDSRLCIDLDRLFADP